MILGSEIVVDSGCDVLRQSIDRALGAVSEERLELRPQWLDLSRALSAGEPRVTRIRVALVGARSSTGGSAEDVVRRLRESNRSLAIFGCMTGPLEYREVLRSFTRAGLDDAFTLVHEINERELRHAVIGRLLAPAPDAVLQRAQLLRLPAEVRCILLYLLRRGYLAESVDIVAQRWGVSRDTLKGRLHDAGLPDCGDIQRLTCDLHAGALRRQGGMSGDEIAHRVARPGAHALKLMRRRLAASERRDPRLAELSHALRG